jgi:dGTPase
MTATSSGYDAHACARLVDEPVKNANRTSFERDRARVLHSAALRRLAAKTQVVGPQSDDFVRNRLTHSLEVAQVARDLGRRIGCDPDVVETAALAHDLGHPPFGHNGERILDELSPGCGGFEGNAQTLRVLTRLEAKSADGEGRSIGLNLTRATLDACCKYPWTREDAAGVTTTPGGGSVKFGVYADDLSVFKWLREDAPDGIKCLEAQVMDLSDDVAYSVHDLEDGVVAERIDLGWLRDRSERRAVWATLRDWYLPEAEDAALEEVLERLQQSPSWPTTPYDGSRGSLAVLKNLTSDLIGRFCGAVQEATHAAYGTGGLTRYAADLIVPEDTLLEIACLKGIAAHYVMRAEDRQANLRRQREVIADLVSVLRMRGPEVLDPAFRIDFGEATDDSGRLRVIIDQIASLTDASALAWHARLG